MDRYINLGKELKSDLKWWQQAVSSWNGIYLFEETTWLNPNIQKFYTDASNIGGGATFNDYFTVFLWSNELNPAKVDINIRELIAIIVAVLTFKSLWTRKKYLLFTDNASCVDNIKRGYASNDLANTIIRDLFIQQIVFSFAIRVNYIPTHDNQLADMLSRGQHRKFIKQNSDSIYITPVIPSYLSHLINTVPSLSQ